MKKIFIFLIMVSFTFGCDTGRINNNNPNIPNYTVNLQINMNLNSDIQFATHHYVDYSQGARGVVVFNTGSGYVAYDLACPNQSFTTCTSPINIPVGSISATCSCDNTVYNLFTGQCAGQPYPLKQYHVDAGGGYIYVTN
jgi:nitrite reductase/ring-hydroxylating ferredoxin subunit